MLGKSTLSRFMAVIFLSGLFFAGQGCIIEYISDPLPPQGESSTSLMVIIHGSGATPDDWPQNLESAIDARLSPAVRQSWDIVRYGWEEYASNSFLAAGAGTELGKQVGTMLAGEDYTYTQIHFIAHGVGSFVAHWAATTYIAAGGPAGIHITYLDPVSSANAPLGSGTDFSEDYFNSSDPVAASNTAVANSHNFDVTNYLLRDVGTAEGHVWPVNYYLLSVEDDRIPYGFQLSPMVNPTPVGFGSFPAGVTTALYDEIPIETVNLSTGPMELPIRYTDSTMISTFFDADRAVVEAKLAGTPFDLAIVNGDRTLVGLAFYEYRASSIGPYVEVGLAIPVVPAGAPLPANWLLDITKPPLDREMAFYVLNIPADSEVGVAAGIEIWGFTKVLTDIDFSHAGSTIDMTVYDPDSSTTILNFAGEVGSGIPMPNASSVTLSVLNDIPLKTINYATGTATMYLSHDLLLTIGASAHPMAQNLRDMGVDGTAPATVMVSTDYQSVLYFGNPM